MPISVVIPLKDNSNETELYYAVLSLKKHLKNISDIFVVSNKKPQTKDIIWIKETDLTGKTFKEKNIYRKIICAIADERVTDNFLFTNDDIFLNKDFDAEKFPYFYKGTLYDTMIKQNSDYRRSLNHSRKFLIEKNLTTFDYDTHCPIIYNKDKFLEYTKGLDWKIQYGYVIKSIYANQLQPKSILSTDCKIKTKHNYQQLKSIISQRQFFSVADNILNNDFIKILKEMYD